MGNERRWIGIGLLWLMFASSVAQGQLIGELASPLLGESIDDLAGDSGNPPRKWAILVGVNQYSQLQPLKYGRHDAERMYQVLTERCGYEPRFITLMTDGEHETARRPLKHNIANQLGRVFAEVHPRDHVLVFFTGHGFVSDDGEGYLATQESDVEDLPRTALSANRVMQQLESLQARQKILILDCCLERSGSADDESLDAKFDVASLPLQFSDARGLVTFASCSPGQSSWELAAGGNGVFTHFLAKGLEGDSDRAGNRNGKVELTELVRYTTDQVAHETEAYGSKQVPMAIFGPQTDRAANVLAYQTAPFLIQSAVGDKWSRSMKVTRTFQLNKGDRPTELVLTRQLEAEHSIRSTVPAQWGRPQGSIAVYRDDRKSISGRRHRFLGIPFPPSLSVGELRHRVLRHSIDTFGSEAKVDRSDDKYLESVNGSISVPAIAAIHPIQIDEAVLPQPGSQSLDAERLLTLMRRISPNCDPVFESHPTISTVTEDAYLGGRATRFHGNAVVNARVGTAEAHNIRMRFVCQFEAVYSRKLRAVVHFKCRADGVPFDNLNNDETLQHTIDIELNNALLQRLASSTKAKASS
ncbi:MAG: caspase family protein [Planctomycetota bacterium]